jgi:3-oxoacyl-[acyl-carrier protein] reductase
VSERLKPTELDAIESRFRLDGDVALVTGAGRGIGRAIALGLAASGADVAALDIDPDTAAATADEVHDTFDVAATAITADLTDTAAVERGVAETVEVLGDLDVLVNNAGTNKVQNPTDIDGDDWDLLQAVNLRSAFLCSRAAYEYIRDGGRIINLSSVVGTYGSREYVHYGAAKAGVRNLTRSLANAWADEGVRANAIAPGAIYTTGASDLMDVTPERAYDRSRPARLVGSPAEVADVATFLACPAASFVTGVTIPVAGRPPVFEDLP